MVKPTAAVWLRDAAYDLIALQDRVVSRWLGRRQVATEQLEELREVVRQADCLGRDIKLAFGDPDFSGWDDLRRRNDDLWLRIGELSDRRAAG